MKKKVVVAVGGTGGHIFPALSFAKKFQQENKSAEIHFIGGGLTKNPYFDKSFSYSDISCGNFSKKLKSNLRSFSKISKGIWQSYRLLSKHRPDLIVGFGSYHTLPLLSSAKLKGIPIILHESNSIPGRVNRFFSRFALKTCIFFPGTANHLKGFSIPVEMPLREGYATKINKDAALEHFNLSKGKITLLVFGGSQGAQFINELMMKSLPLLPQNICAQIQILHFTGDSTLIESLEKLYSSFGVQALVKKFETNMNIAWQASDMMITRSGSGTIAEAIAFEKPGIFIPYRYAMDNHQEFNADFMVNFVKGAIKLRETEITANKFADKLTELITDNGIALLEMKNNIYSYKKNMPSDDLCHVVNEFLK